MSRPVTRSRTAKDKQSPQSSSAASQSTQGTPIPFMGTNQGVGGADFDRNVLYEDRFAPEVIDFDNEIQVAMDPELKEFLNDVIRADNIYLETMLTWNGVRNYKHFKELVVDTHNFTDLNHVYEKLGPNALGQKVVTTERMVMLGHWIAIGKIKNNEGELVPMTIYDPENDIFLPQAFNKRAWLNYWADERRTFGLRYTRASIVTFNVYRNQLHVVNYSPAQRRHATITRIDHSGGLNVSAIQTSNEEHNLSLPGQHDLSLPGQQRLLNAFNETLPGTNVSSKNSDHPTSTVVVKSNANITEPSDDPSSSSSSSTSSSSSSEDHSDSSDDDTGDSDSTSSSSSSDNDSHSDDDSSNSSGTDSSSDTDSSDDNSTMPSKWGTKKYKPPKSKESFMKRIKSYEKKAKNRKRGKIKQGKRSKKSKKTKKALKRKSSSSRSKSYLKKRSVLTMKAWNGHEPFEDVANHIRNFVEQQPSMHYIVTEDFMRLYSKGDYKSYLRKEKISHRQFTYDMQSLHAYLSTAFEKYTPTWDILYRYRNTFKGGPDGIKAYQRLVKVYGLGGAAHDQQLVALMHHRSMPYSAEYKGGLRKYVDQFQTSCSEIERYRNKNKPNKKLSRDWARQNCTQLLINLGEEKEVQAIYTTAYNLTASKRDYRNFEALCNHVRSMATNLNNPYAMKRRGVIKRANVRLATMMEEVQDTMLEDDMIDDIALKDVSVMFASNFDSTKVPPLIWSRLDDATRQKIFGIRKLLQNERRTQTDATVETRPTSNVSNLRANLATRLDDGESLSSDCSTDTDGTTDPDVETGTQNRAAMKMLAELITDNLTDRKVCTMRSVRCDLQKLETMKGASMQVIGALGQVYMVGISTMDSEADTSILGGGWREVAKNPGQSANLFGFDPKFAQKLGLPIGTGDTIVTGYDATNPSIFFVFILRIHQAVLNKDCETSLISELQARDNNAIVDTVHSDFMLDTEGNKGTQSITIQVPANEERSACTIVIPLSYKRGLMIFEHRYPQDADYDCLPIYELTSKNNWDPRKYTDSRPFARDSAGIPRAVHDIQANRHTRQLAPTTPTRASSFIPISFEPIPKSSRALEEQSRQEMSNKIQELRHSLNRVKENFDNVTRMSAREGPTIRPPTPMRRRSLKDENASLKRQIKVLQDQLEEQRLNNVMRRNPEEYYKQLKDELAWEERQNRRLRMQNNELKHHAQRGDRYSRDCYGRDLYARSQRIGDHSMLDLESDEEDTTVARAPSTSSDNSSISNDDDDVKVKVEGPVKSVKRYKSTDSEDEGLPEAKKIKMEDPDPDATNNNEETEYVKVKSNDDVYTWYFDDGFGNNTTQQSSNVHEKANSATQIASSKDTVPIVQSLNLTMNFKDMLDRGEDKDDSKDMDEIDALFNELSLEQITGMKVEDNGNNVHDTYAFAIKAVRDFRESELEKLCPNFAFRPVDIIWKTLENTTQYARAFSPFPLHKHWKSMFKWFNFQRLQETVCTDTVFVNVLCIGTGSTCAQVFYGVKSKMINIYGMMTKADAHEAYQDFLREEGIPVTLHRDNAGEQNDTRFKSTNRDLLVKDTTTEPYHPHQNPAETRAIRFLKRAGKSLITMSGAPAETWFYAMKYVAQINNWTSHESLDWKTPHEKRHGTQPDISPLLAYKFYQLVYYYVQEGFPNSGEKLWLCSRSKRECWITHDL